MHLTVWIKGIKIEKNPHFVCSMDPHVEVRVGTQKQQTRVFEEDDELHRSSDKLLFTLKDQDKIILTAYDDDNFCSKALGRAYIHMKDVYQNKGRLVSIYPLCSKNWRGTVTVDIELKTPKVSLKQHPASNTTYLDEYGFDNESQFSDQKNSLNIRSNPFYSEATKDIDSQRQRLTEIVSALGITAPLERPPVSPRYCFSRPSSINYQAASLPPPPIVQPNHSSLAERLLTSSVSLPGRTTSLSKPARIFDSVERKPIQSFRNSLQTITTQITSIYHHVHTSTVYHHTFNFNPILSVRALPVA